MLPSLRMAAALSVLLVTCAALAAEHPPVGASPGEPTWPELLKRQFDLDVDLDLRNPSIQGAPAGLFVKAKKDRPVTFTPLLALGMETKTHAGWYAAGPKASDLPAEVLKQRVELWTYAFKQPPTQIQSGEYTPPPLETGQASFDPGLQPFGLWVSNESFDDGGVYSQPALVAKVNARLRAQPYKAMIYPVYEPKAKRAVPDSYLIGWEYSTNDDFQDVITRVDNVRLLPSDPQLKGVLAPNASVEKLAGGFQFTEGPAWDPWNKVLYFSDIPAKQIVAYSDGRARIAKNYDGQTNGLMFDRTRKLIGCEHAGRRVARDVLGDNPEVLAAEYNGKKLNSPNDLWLDAHGGIYFTDPRYGPTADLEQDKFAVYYIARDKTITRIIDDLVKPNGIAVSPGGDYLYVVDNGADHLYRYKIEAPGRIGPGKRIAVTIHPDGMSLDREGRLYVTTHGGVTVLQPDGRWLGLIDTPEQPANCTFGGPEARTLFMTARTSLLAIETATRGWHVHLDGERAAK